MARTSSTIWIRKDQPDQGAVHVNRPLGNISLAYFQDQAKFVADKVFHNIPVEKQTDLYFKYPKGAFFRDEMEPRGPGAETAGGGWDVQTDSYACIVYGWHHDVTDQRRSNEDSPLSSDRTATILATTKALLNREVAFATNYLSTGKWTQDWTGNSSSSNYGSKTFQQWDNVNSTPLEDVAAMKDYQEQLTGFEPMNLLVTKPVWTALKNHPEIKDRIKFGASPQNPGKITLAAVAALMELDEIIVMRSVKDTSAEPAAFSGSYIGGKCALLYYKPDAPGIEVPAAGYVFGWRGYTGANDYGMRIKKFRMENLASDRIEVEQAYQQKIIGADLAQFLATAVS